MAAAVERAYRRGMGRPRHVEEPNAIFHVTTRGNDRRDIFFGDWSGRLFVDELERASRRYGWRVIAYCLMTNHHHLVVRLPEPGLAAGMCELNGRFARMTNKQLARTDHVFGRRYWREEILTVDHLFEACRYVLNNPVDVIPGVADPTDWAWSSARATLGASHPPPFLDAAYILNEFSDDPVAARAGFAEFLRDGLSRG